MKGRRSLSMLVAMILSTSATFGYVDDCKELRVGASKKVNHGRHQSRSLVTMKYSLKRSGDSTYQVYLNLNFENETPHTYQDINKTWKERIQGCYALYNEKDILIDGFGRKLKLNIWEKNLHRDVPRPPAVKIKIKSYPHRSNSIEYSNFIGCEAILHEALHLVGLADEYEETVSVLNPSFLERVTGKPLINDRDAENAFDCRASEIEDSIMTDHYNAGKGVSVLRSGHMDTIIYPNCSRKNSTYYACVKNFQRTSRANGSFFGCARMPDICHTDNWAGI